METSRDERTYAFEDETDVVPFAERVSGDWLFYSSDIAGTPEELVAADGSVVGIVDRSAYGVSTTSGIATSLRFPGQMADEETGLAYNYHRYYDAENGRYISPAPMGVAAGLNAFKYCSSPVDTIDPFGLDEHSMNFAIVDKNGAPQTGDWPPKLTSGLKPGKAATATFQKELDELKKTDPAAAAAQEKKWKQLGTGDTEQKALHLLGKPPAKDHMDKGGTAKMAGQFPLVPRATRP